MKTGQSNFEQLLVSHFVGFSIGCDFRLAKVWEFDRKDECVGDEVKYNGSDEGYSESFCIGSHDCES